MNSSQVDETLARQMGMSKDEFSHLLSSLGREPTLCELGIVSAMWSEHCSYKSSRVHLKRLPSKGKAVVQGPGENAGAVDIGNGYCVVFKMESHNHPSYIEPFQGAATGVGGILRDVFTMGARPIALLDSLRFGDPKLNKTKYLVHGVVSGIAHYGNCIGVPVVGGEVTFDPAYDGNCLVNVCAVGVARTEKLFLGKAAGVGNDVFYLGAKTGRDGIHGATMASDELSVQSESKRPTVQIGDPFKEKMLLECCLELMEKDLLIGIQDMGAAGLTSSAVEMASRANNGLELDLDKVPIRESKMSAYEMMLSESQERMLLVAKPGCQETLQEVAQKWDLDAISIGTVTDTKRLIIKAKGKIEADLPISLLADEAPKYDRPQTPPSDLESRFLTPSLAPPRNLATTILALLSHPDLASKRWIYEQYDHQVRLGTLAGPEQADAAVIRVLDPADSSKDTNAIIALSSDCPVRACSLDPKRGAALAVYEAARNLACVGATPIGLTDCLNLGNPEKPEIAWQLSEVIDGLSEACRALDVPVVSGNVSLYNENRGRAIHPTPAVAMVGLLRKAGEPSETPVHIPGLLFRAPDEHIAILGDPLAGTLAGSLYAFAIHGRIRGRPPKPNPDQEIRIAALLRTLVQKGMLSSLHDVSTGGLVIALARGTMGGIGATITLPEGSLESLLFGEGHPLFVLSYPESQMNELARLVKESDLPFGTLGKTGGDILQIDGDGRRLGTVQVEEIHKSFSQGFGQVL